MPLKYLKKHYNIVIFLNILLIIGIILGLILGFKQDSIFKTDIVNSLTDLQSKNIINFTLTKDNTYLLAIKNNLFGITLTEGICLIYDCFLFIFSNFLISKFIWLF